MLTEKKQGISHFAPSLVPCGGGVGVGACQLQTEFTRGEKKRDNSSTPKARKTPLWLSKTLYHQESFIQHSVEV